MLGKLIKYEWKATARLILPLYLAVVVLAVIYKLLSLLSPHAWQAPQVISMVIYIFLIIATFIMVFVVMIQRFYKNLLTEEGYLSFTLPVQPWKHIISKLLLSLFWVITSVLVAGLSVLIVVFSPRILSM